MYNIKLGEFKNLELRAKRWEGGGPKLRNDQKFYLQIIF